MPLNQTVQTNPINLNKNIAIGISLPFNTPSAFKSTYDFKTQLKYNLINLLLTNKGERIMNPEFGCDLGTVLFEGITDDTKDLVRNLISTNINIFVPEVQIDEILVEDAPQYNNNSISVTVKYRMRISQNPDQVTVQFI